MHHRLQNREVVAERLTGRSWRYDHRVLPRTNRIPCGELMAVQPMDAPATQRRGQARLEIGRKFGVSALARGHNELAGNAFGMASLDGGKEDSDIGSLHLCQNCICPWIVKKDLFDVLHGDGPVHAHPDRMGILSLEWALVERSFDG